VIYAGQLQLGAIFLGLFGAAALLLYLHVSALTPLPTYGTFAIGFAALCCLAILVYRHSRYIETGAIDPTARAARLLSPFGKVLNPVISVLVVLVIVLAGMEFSAVRLPPSIPADPSQAGSSIPLMGLAALALLPLFSPLASIVHWQRLAAMEKDKEAYQGDTARWLAALRRIFRIQAIETPLLWLFIASLGAIGIAALDPSGGTEIMRALVREAASGDNPIAAAAFALLLVAVMAIALSTIASGFLAGLCSLRYDILPAQAETSSGNIGGRLFFLAIVLALIVASEMLPMDFTSESFLAFVFALGCPVLSFAPLIVSAIFNHRSTGPVWALSILASGVVCMAGGLIGFIATGNDAWLWGSVPACLAAGFSVTAAAWLSHGSLMR
jgi:hypothetical protein